MRYVLGLGANLGDREAALTAVREALDRLPDTAVTAVSSLYETAAVGYTDQPDFLNQAVVIESALSPHGLLGACLGIEAALGRVRSFRNAPRVVDVDVLLAEGYAEQTEELTVPHPRMAQRAFVMVPLRELERAGALAGLVLPQETGETNTQKIRLFKKFKKI